VIISYPGLSIEPVGNTLVLRLDAINSDDGESPRPTTHVVHDPPVDETACIEAVYKAVCDMAQHEVSEWFRVDGKRWRAPHPQQPTHQPRVYMPARDYALVRSCCVMLLDYFTCPVEVLLTGSTLERPNYNDIDIRFRIPDENYRALSESIHIRGLGILMTEFGRHFTGLPLDVQIRADSSEPMTSFPSLNIIDYRGVVDL
jgi:hypothetical protein